MKCAWFATLVGVVALSAAGQQSTVNVNSRYIVERVEISDGLKTRISRTLREDLEKLVGEKLNPAALDKLARRIRTELRARHVTEKVSRGTQPERVIVLFEVTGRKTGPNFDVTLPRGIYHAKQGWSGALDSKVTIASNEFTLGVVSDGDELLERFAGVRAGYENTKVGTDRIRLGFQFSSYHQKWSPRTVAALEDAREVPGIYRTRQEFAPAVTFVLAQPLTLSAGASFQHIQTQFPAAHTESANAVTTTLRFARRLEDSRSDKHDVTAGYTLRAATRVLNTDFVYSQHQMDLGYVYTRDRHRVAASFAAGRLSGTAPLFERFVLGNTATLRGWHKYDLNALGGTRMAHGSLEYRYHWFEVFYDTGALWNKGEEAEAKHSLGIGLRTKGGFFMALAFPIRSGRAEPIFMIGTGD
jgi:hypothetical protein